MSTTLRKIIIFVLMNLFLSLTVPSQTLAHDINEKLTVEGMLTGVFQYGDFDVEGIDDADRGVVVLDIGANFHPTDVDEFQITLSYAAGNGLNTIIPFSLVPYADDLEDDLKDINGRNRDYLLEAWYKHTFVFSEDVSLGITGGIIDATVYIDDNAFANCECTQFMNEIFVNHTNVNLPSYDLGGVVELDIKDISIKGLLMNTKYETDDNNFRNYNYYAIQIGYSLNTSLGKGNYRIYGFTTNKRFQCWDATEKDSLKGFGISADQKLGDIIGVFARLGWQNDKAVINHDELYSGGVNINGQLWGRKNDEIGIGYAYLEGACKSGIANTNVFEAYTKFQITKFSDLTLDIQYMNDNLRDNKEQDGVIYGVRLNAY
ncbi:MAG TPA: porin, partial [bacterium (Candidatus Stahlbacteria)]|nr:porin [Candidatus Stahlbacteria bacterium]